MTNFKFEGYDKIYFKLGKTIGIRWGGLYTLNDTVMMLKEVIIMNTCSDKIDHLMKN